MDMNYFRENHPAILLERQGIWRDLKPMKFNGTTYQSFLLRLWCERDGGDWRASIENVATRECHNFANMTSLFAFLCNQAGQSILSINPNDLDVYRSKSIPTPVFIDYSKEEV